MASFLIRLPKIVCQAALSIIALTAGSAAVAWDIPQTQPTPTDGQRVMPTDFTQQKGEGSLADSKDTAEPPRVRIGLTLTPYRKFVYSTEKGTEIKFKPDVVITHMLRARMDRPNHFFVNDFHIESTPISWDKKTAVYRVRLAFFHRFGSYGQIEEAIGNLELAGSLKGRDGLYLLTGTTSTKLQNKRGEPIVDVTAGTPKAPKPPVADVPNNSIGQHAPRAGAPKPTPGQGIENVKPRSVDVATPGARPTPRNTPNDWQAM